MTVLPLYNMCQYSKLLSLPLTAEDDTLFLGDEVNQIVRVLPAPNSSAILVYLVSDRFRGSSS